MGLGKTRIALATVRELRRKAFVVAPAFLESNWRREAKDAGVELIFCAYSQLHKIKDTDKRAFWIADEAHYLKNHKAKRTIAYVDMVENIRPDYWLGMTGTPIKNRVPDFWTLLYIANIRTNRRFMNYWEFCRKFCVEEKIRVAGGSTVSKYRNLKPEMAGELKAMLDGFYIKYRADQVLKDLPEMTAINQQFRLAEVAGLEEEFQKYQTGHKVNPVAKALSAKLKASATIEYCKELIEGGSGQLLVFTDHIEPAVLIAEGLGGKVITGGVAMDERQRAVDDFQAGRLQALVCTIGSMSVGVTLTAASHVVFNDLSWTPADNEQAAKRIHRIGQRNACFAHYISASDTDSYIQKTLLSKKSDTDALIG
jgi:SWI/SNF-related matrix-associated actin-dependent regulator 1 of chromatin subfamily A